MCSDLVKLNVGGQVFETSRSTLLSYPDTTLANLISASSSDHFTSGCDVNGAIFIDRSPTYFAPLLNFLRTGKLILDDGINLQGVLEEAKFFGLHDIEMELEGRLEEEKMRSGPNRAITRHEIVAALMGVGASSLAVSSTNSPECSRLRCQGVNFRDQDLRFLDLSGVNFRFADLSRCDLSHADLTNCTFEKANLRGACLDEAQLAGARFISATLEDASMRNCLMEPADGSRNSAVFEAACMRGVNLEGSLMTNANLRVCNLKNANLSGCCLKRACLAGADLEGADLTHADLQEANLRGANLINAVLLLLDPLHATQTMDATMTQRRHYSHEEDE